jgi:hypothetical protein
MRISLDFVFQRALLLATWDLLVKRTSMQRGCTYSVFLNRQRKSPHILHKRLHSLHIAVQVSLATPLVLCELHGRWGYSNPVVFPILHNWSPISGILLRDVNRVAVR